VLRSLLRFCRIFCITFYGYLIATVYRIIVGTSRWLMPANFQSPAGLDGHGHHNPAHSRGAL
jgi:hypothetical protein